MISTVLLDLDGVVRHFDPAHLTSVEKKHGLPTGMLMATAFEPYLISAVTTGRIRRAEWTTLIGETIGNQEAAVEWLSEPAVFDWDLLAVVDRLRSEGRTVAILTNGTDTVPAELDAAGVTDRFDAVFNSATIGFAKPDRRAFEHVVDNLRVEPDSVFFTDDSRSKLAGAVELGMTATVYQGVDSFREHLADLGIDTE